MIFKLKSWVKRVCGSDKTFFLWGSIKRIGKAKEWYLNRKRSEIRGVLFEGGGIRGRDVMMGVREIEI